MEEILASIRRIIEDSDGNRKPQDDQVQDARPVGAAPVRADLESFRAELGTASNDD